MKTVSPSIADLLERMILPVTSKTNHMGVGVGVGGASRGEALLIGEKLCRVRNLLRTDINTAKRWVIELPTLQEF